MAIVDFTVTKYGKSRGSGAGTIASSIVRLSGQDTITTEENLEDASGDVTLAVGDVLRVLSDGKMRLAFNGTATATTGHLIPADLLMEFEVERGGEGTVSLIEAV